MKAEQRRRKGSHEHDLAKSRNANKQQREDEEATTRKVGMLHSELRGSNSIARESKQRNMTRTPTCTKLKKHKNKLNLEVERELTRKDSVRRRKKTFTSSRVSTSGTEHYDNGQKKQTLMRVQQYTTKRRYQYKCVARALCRTSSRRHVMRLPI